jgi:hypothetical protein
VEKENIWSLEIFERKILEWREVEWRMKSRAI